MIGWKRRLAVAALALGAVSGIAAPPVAALEGIAAAIEAMPAPEPDDPLAPWVSALQIETSLLQEDLTRQARDRLRREQLTDRINQLYAAIDSGLDNESPEAIGTTRRLLEQLERSLGERMLSAVSERHLMEAILDRRARVLMLQAQIDRLATRDAPVVGALSGGWSVVMLPLEQRGRFELEQTGTLVSGTYHLAGGWSGSLQGTLVNNKVFLVRIDSRLGKSMEYEGYLSADRKTIRGEWRSYELADGEAASGHWSATKE